ncbi:cupin domain-containing protein [Mucilaginibacter sp. OK098]|uniref:cupin domain-containing protein n=1 Tax=Mucilaginibacter sp. OK098 TaxID=1855297 RepID=UPI0009F88C14|nr:cupin domain-containing protein [Mucilaginibacter sp. OK098]
MKKLSISLFALCALLTTSVKAQVSAEASPVKIPPQVILKQLIQLSGIKEQEVTMAIITYSPGETSSAHRHPIPTFGYVLEGKIESTFEGKVYHYKTGDAFFEEPNGLHSGTRNISKDKPAKLLAFFVGDKNKPIIVPEKK